MNLHGHFHSFRATQGALNGGRVVARRQWSGVRDFWSFTCETETGAQTTLWWYGADGSEGAAEDRQMEGIVGMLLAQWSRGCDGGLPWWESNGPGGKDQLAPLAIVYVSSLKDEQDCT